MSTHDPSIPQFLPPSPYAAPISNETTSASVMGIALHLAVTYQASAERVYEALLDECASSRPLALAVLPLALTAPKVGTFA